MKTQITIILAVLLFASAGQAIDIPKGYVLQILEPTGGKIARPKDWFYTEKHHGSVYLWTISRENIKNYKTGLKIQYFVGIKKATGKTPKEFCLSFLDSKQKTAKILSKFPEKKQYIFTRMGLEVEEKIKNKYGIQTFHIIYSVFWANESDLAIITITGSPVDLWHQFKKTFDIMNEFELIDMKRFEKTERTNPLIQK